MIAVASAQGTTKLIDLKQCEGWRERGLEGASVNVQVMIPAAHNGRCGGQLALVNHQLDDSTRWPHVVVELCNR